MMEASSIGGSTPEPTRRSSRGLGVWALLWGLVLYGVLALDVVQYSRATAGLRRALAPRFPWVLPTDREGW